MSKRLAGVVGWPVDHSLSPIIHNHWLKEAGIRDAEYLRLPVEPEKLGEWIQNVRLENYVGVNLTIPHKELILPFLDRIDPVAERMGAVNTVLIKGSLLHGFNTDAYGFIANLQSEGYERNTAFVVGAGGAARAVVAGLLEDGFSKIYLMNRTEAKARELQKLGDGIEIVAWSEYPEQLEACDLLVNTSSLGMHHQPALALDLSALPAHALVTDIVYSPLETKLLREAKAQGLKTVDGLGMLLYQAQKAFEIWFGILPEVNEELRALVLKARESA